MTEAAPKSARTWAMLCHLLALVQLVGVPFGNIIGPLVMWLIKRNDHPFIDGHGKESLNFQISMTIYILVSGLLALFVIGLPILFVVGILDIVFPIVAAVAASDGRDYRYPLTIRFLT